MQIISKTSGFAIVAVIVALVLAWLSLSEVPQRRAFINAKVLTMDANNSIQQAVLVDSGKIVATGSTAGILAMTDKSTHISDLNGRVLMPGIIDAHGHFPGSGLAALAVDLNSPPIGRMQTIADVQQALRVVSGSRADNEWILGYGYDDSLLAEGRHPTRQDLDKVSTEQPIFIMHISGHMGVANSRALALAGIDKQTEAPPGGLIARDKATGEPSGLLEETAATPVQALAMDFGVLDFIQMIRHANGEYLRMGVTTAQSGGVDGRMYSGLRYASKLGLIQPRLVVFPLYDSLGLEMLDNTEAFALHATERFLPGPIKVIADGSIQGYTGYLSQPYHTPYKGDDSYRGYPRMSAEVLAEEVHRYHSRGFQLAIHGNGDAAMDDIIAAFEQANTNTPADDPRLILIHAQMARDDQLDDFLRLGITPSFFSAHTYYWGDRHRDVFMGPERAARMSPAHSSLDKGLRFTIHLDTPVVPMQPFLLVWSAVNRLSASGETIGAGQRIATMDALRAVTIDAAWQVFQEDNRGSIEAGKWADMLVLSDDPLLNPLAIRDIEVLETLVAGKTVYTRPEQ